MTLYIVASCLLALVWNGLAQSSLNQVLSSRPENFQTFLNAIKTHQFGKSLDARSRKATVFAPTDRAFQRWFQSWGISENEFLADSGPPGVDCLLQYIVIPEAHLEAHILEGLLHQGSGYMVATAPSLAGQWCSSVPRNRIPTWMLYLPMVSDFHGKGEVQIDGAVVLASNLQWKNGIIHIVDAVPNPVFWHPRKPGNLESVLKKHQNLQTFTRILRAAGVLDFLDARGSQTHKYTLFAPTDVAFTKLLERYRMTEAQLLAGDARGSVTRLAGLLLMCGYGRESDLWLGAAARGGHMNLDTWCPCGGRLFVEARGRIGDSKLVVGHANIIAADQMWLGGVYHVLDAVPPPPCWTLPNYYETTAAPYKAVFKPEPELEIMSENLISENLMLTFDERHNDCDIDQFLEVNMDDSALLLRAALEANGFGERMEMQNQGTTFFAPTDEALYRLISEWRLSEYDVAASNLRGNDCITNVFKNLIHVNSKSSKELLQLAKANGGNSNLTTLCGSECGAGLMISTHTHTGELMVGASKIVHADLSWCNGVIHVIDKVPVPSNWSPHSPTCTVRPETRTVAVAPKLGGEQEAVSASSFPYMTVMAAAGLATSSLLFIMCLHLLFKCIPQGKKVVPLDSHVSTKEFDTSLYQPHKKPKHIDEGKKPSDLDLVELESSSTCCPSEASLSSALSSLGSFSCASSYASFALGQRASRESVSPRSIKDQAFSDIASQFSRNSDTLSQVSSTYHLPPSESPLSSSRSGTSSITSSSPSISPAQGELIELDGGWYMKWSTSCKAYYYWHAPSGKSQWSKPSSIGSASPTVSKIGQSEGASEAIEKNASVVGGRFSLKQTAQFGANNPTARSTLVRQRSLPALQEHAPHTSEEDLTPLATSANAKRPRHSRVAQDGGDLTMQRKNKEQKKVPRKVSRSRSSEPPKPRSSSTALS